MKKMEAGNPADYRNVLGQFCTGVTVITSIDGGEPVGFTCQSFSSLSLDPPLVLLSPQKTSTSWPRIRKTGKFVVNILSSRQQWISDSFSKSGTEKFEGVDHSISHRGLPVLDETLAWIECDFEEEVDAGDHTIVIGSIQDLGVGVTGEPLLFHRGRYLRVEERNC